MSQVPKEDAVLERIRQLKSVCAVEPLQVHESESESVVPHRIDPALNGRLAEFLSHVPARSVDETLQKLAVNGETWCVSDPEEKAAVAIAMTLTSHIIRFSRSIISENTFNRVRDRLLCEFSAGDAIHVEEEAYALIHWFAHAFDAPFRAETEKGDENGGDECHDRTVIGVLEAAIRAHCDLNMRYYTGTRKEFSERRITPIEVTAEKFLKAYCHTRLEERVFRISRIVRLSPFDSAVANPECYTFPCQSSEAPEPPRDDSWQKVPSMPQKMPSQRDLFEVLKSCEAQSAESPSDIRAESSPKPAGFAASKQGSLFDFASKLPK